MNRTPRWQIWVPRLLLVAVVVLAAQFALGLVARSIAIRSARDFTSARVEIGNSRVSLIDRKLVLHDLRFEDPRHAGGELLQADRCELEVAARPLLHKQAVVNRGRLSGVHFSAFDPSGTASAPALETAPTIKWLGDDSGVVATQWFAHLAERFKQSSIDQFASVRRTEAFCEKWAAESASLESRGTAINKRVSELQQAVDATRANPLRGEKRLDDLPEAIAGLQNDFAALNADLAKLPDQLEAERRAIVAARRQDETLARKRVTLEPVEANALSSYLLRTQAVKPLNEMIAWLRWLRATVPTTDTPQPRGQDVLFAGVLPAPNLIVRGLDIRGTARIAAQPVEFRGTLAGLSTQPELMAEPLRLRLEATGSMPVELQAIVDRTHGLKRDSLLMDCQGILLPRIELGAPDELAISMEPSVGALSLSVALDGDRLTGDIQMVQKNVRLKPALAGALYDVPIAGALEETLGRVDTLATRMTLGGTLAQPTCTLWSNLGPATAEAIERALDRASGQQGRALMVAAGQHVDERLTGVERQMVEQQSRWANRVADVSAQLRNVAANEEQTGRLSPERLGRRLPSNSLFR